MKGSHLFLSELRRRRVLHSLVIWGIVALAILQVYEPIMHGLHLPEWTLGFVVVSLALGFPVTAALSWLFDIKFTSSRRASSGGGDRSPAPERLAGFRLAALLAGVGIAAATPGISYFFVWPGAGRMALSELLRHGPRPGNGQVVAVSGFASLGPGLDAGDFSDALSEEILVSLTRAEGLRVVGRVLDLPFKGHPDDVQRVGRAARADFLLSGYARRTPDRVRVHAVLVSVSDGYPIWTRTYERDVRDGSLPLQEIAEEIAEQVRARVDASTAEARLAAKRH
jgi:TolB-like protein